MPSIRSLIRFVPVSLTCLLAACGGGSAGSGVLSLAVADAPVDGAQHVVVMFTGAVLLPDSGNPVEIDFAQPKTIDLLTQSGTASAVLFDQPIPAGSYGQVRLLVVADGNPANSFIQMSDGTVHGLQVPSGSQTGLKLVSGFMVPDGGVVDYTIDFDLRKAITCPGGQSPACFLQPALRLVNNAQVGNIAGTVDPGLVAPQGCTPGVYLYDGNVTAPEDMNSAAPSTDTNQPVASKVPVQTSNGLAYQFTFLQPGTYTVAFTCQAAQDDPAQDDHLTYNPIKTGNAVSAGQTTTANLP